MYSRVPPLLGGVAVFFAGLVAGRITAPATPAPRVVEAAAMIAPTSDGPVARSRPPGRSTADPTCPRVEELEVQVVAQQFVIDSMEAELYGVPLPWPEDLPDKYRPDVFKDNLERVIEECGVDIEVIDYDCDEPPCLARFRRDQGAHSSDDQWYQQLRACEPWTELYGEALSMATGSVPCPDGSSEGYTLLGASIPQPGQPDIDDWEAVKEWYDSMDEDERAAMANRSKRFQTRVQAAEDGWACAGQE